MSWLPQRWRTQWNAIRHANRRIQWVIKILNAACTSYEVCLLECLFLLYPFLKGFVHRFFWNACRCKNDRQSIHADKSIINIRLKRHDVKYPCLIECMNRLWFVLTLDWATIIGPPISQEYPLNLSILLGGGKETNKDSLSNGEWSGNSSEWKSSELCSREVILAQTVGKISWNRVPWRVTAPSIPTASSVR